VQRAGPYDRFELDVKGGPCGGARVRFAVEEHGEGRQYLRFRVWPRLRRGAGVSLLGAGLVAAAMTEGAWLAAVIVGAGSLVGPGLGLLEAGRAQGGILEAINRVSNAAARANPDGVADATS
jgi:hypothetical protein